MTEVRLPPLHELEPAPRRNGFRIAPRSWPGPADAGRVARLVEIG